MKKFVYLVCCSLFLLIQPKCIYSQTSGYKISGSINIGGKGWWDYLAVDTSMHRLFVSHTDRIHVIDLNNDKIIGEIPNLNGVHGIAFAYKLGKGFISNGRSDTVTVINLKTLKTIDHIHVTSKDPDAIVYDSFTQRIFTFNGRSANSTAIDAKSDKVVGTLALEGSPEFAVSNTKGVMYVNLENKSEIEEFNPKTLKKVVTWSIAPGEHPSGLAIDVKNNILFSGCQNNMMMIVNAKTGKVITHVPIGGHVDACRYDPETHLTFSSNGEGNLTIIKEVSPKNFKEIENITTQKGLRTMALDPVTHNIYLVGMLLRKDGSKSFGILILRKR